MGFCLWEGVMGELPSLRAVVPVAAAPLRAAGTAAREAAARAEYRNFRLSIMRSLVCPTPLPDGGVRDAGQVQDACLVYFSCYLELLAKQTAAGSCCFSTRMWKTAFPHAPCRRRQGLHKRDQPVPTGSYKNIPPSGKIGAGTRRPLAGGWPAGLRSRSRPLTGILPNGRFSPVPPGTHPRMTASAPAHDLTRSKDHALCSVPSRRRRAQGRFLRFRAGPSS